MGVKYVEGDSTVAVMACRVTCEVLINILE